MVITAGLHWPRTCWWSNWARISKYKVLLRFWDCYGRLGRVAGGPVVGASQLNSLLVPGWLKPGGLGSKVLISMENNEIWTFLSIAFRGLHRPKKEIILEWVPFAIRSASPPTKNRLLKISFVKTKQKNKPSSGRTVSLSVRLHCRWCQGFLR